MKAQHRTFLIGSIMRATIESLEDNFEVAVVLAPASSPLG
jgi:hypothetical protein